jgi:hypothetical protein
MKAAVRMSQKFISDTNPIPNSKQFPNFHIHNVYLFAKILEQRAFALGLALSFLHCSDAARMIHSMRINNYNKGKGKAITLQAWTGPEVSRRFRLPDFKTIGT